MDREEDSGYEIIEEEELQEILRGSKKISRPAGFKDVWVATASNFMYKAEDLAKSFMDPGPQFEGGSSKLMGQPSHSKESMRNSLVEFSMNLFWMSYRQFAHPLIDPNDGSECFQDTNWGCTIRCAQMQFAYIYKDIYSKFRYSQVVKLFLDDGHARYGIHKICEKAYSMYNAKIKTYWSPLTAQQALTALYKENFEEELEEKRVRFLLFHNNTFSMKQGDLFDDKKDEYDFYIINIVGMVGSENVDVDNFRFIRKCMKIPSFCGIIGGIGNRALYIIGYCNDYLLYLDPHLTQQAIVQTDNEDQVSTYRVSHEKGSPSRIKASKYTCFKSSISLTFKVKSKQAVIDLITRLNKILEMYPECSFYIDPKTAGLGNTPGTKQPKREEFPITTESDLHSERLDFKAWRPTESPQSLHKHSSDIDSSDEFMIVD
jgi:hypothetical protein